eukprot:jgi/Tetstr1/463513/TSEL_008392.t1
MQREVERAPVAEFDEFEALVLEAPLVVWDLCGARFPRSGARAAAIPTSARPVAVLIGDILVAPTASQPSCTAATSGFHHFLYCFVITGPPTMSEDDRTGSPEANAQSDIRRGGDSHSGHLLTQLLSQLAEMQG